jgi:L-2,4-diaminobutyrate decarboxylase
MHTITEPINAIDEFAAIGHGLIDVLADYLRSVQTQTEKTVIPYQEPEAALRYWQTDFAGGQGDVLTFFKEVIARTNHLHHPRYMGHQVPPPDPLAALAGLLTGLLNNGGAVYEMGMVANPLEEILTDWLAQICGYDPAAGGILTSGGTLANLTALLAARAHVTDVWEMGTDEKLAVLVSEEAHYCIDRAARIMGLGTEGVIKIPTDERFKIRTDLLEAAYASAQEKGLKIIAVVGSAGSTSTGSYDDLETLAGFSSKYKIWFHVDGAHGGAVVFSDKLRHLTAGIARADSMVLDFHKMLMIPALVTALIFKRGRDAYQTFQQKAQYLWSNQQTEEWYNPGKRTFECTKLMMSVKIYTLIKAHGKTVFAKNVETLYHLGKTFAAFIADRPRFDLGVQPESNIVCFRYLGQNSEASVTDLNALNTTIRLKILRGGKFYIVQTLLRDKVYLRVSLMNPLTSESDLIALLDEIESISL